MLGNDVDTRLNRHQQGADGSSFGSKAPKLHLFVLTRFLYMIRPPDQVRESFGLKTFPIAFSSEVDPVRVKKTRQNKRLEPGSDSIRTDKALVAEQGMGDPVAGLDPVFLRRARDNLQHALGEPA